MITKATLYLDTSMYQTLKLRAVETGQTLSALMNEALKAQLSEDLEDITSIRERRSLRETPLSYDEALKELKNGGIL
jgi:predicted DNA-binding protein